MNESEARSTRGNPTPYADLNAILADLVKGARASLGGNFIGAYLQGSFALGDFDVHSDVDFLIVVEHDLSADDLARLQDVHSQIFDLQSPWAQHLEGSYFPKDTLKRCSSVGTALWFLGNCGRELVRSDHDDKAHVRWIAREHGITLAGPPPQTLIGPVPTDVLRQEALATMRVWANHIASGGRELTNRWAQPYVVLSYCRMLNTLRTGTVVSKRAAAEWAATALDPTWTDLIQRAWNARPDPSAKVKQAPDESDIRLTRDFVAWALKDAGA